MATQGLANYLLKSFPDKKDISIAIAFDSRNNSRFFAQIAADVLSANNIMVYLFENLRPTPELSFAIRYLKCESGIVITASHNPKEYNGYKVYWNDGGQLVSPHDSNVIAEVKNIASVEEVRFDGNPDLIQIIGNDIDTMYLEKLHSLSISPDIIKQHKDLKIVYTPIHGTGITLVPKALKMFGFENVIIVEQQSIPDGNFPTTPSPNPEERAAMELALAKANETQAAIALATDPDADRVGVAVKNTQGEYVLLNGNQAASLLIYYILNQMHHKNLLREGDYIVKTVVTSELLKNIAQGYGLECFDVLTGFKFIADKIRQLEGKQRFVAGGEESYGYLVGDFVRDKDAVSACCLLAETAAWAASQGKTMYELLNDIYVKFGFYKEHLVSLTKKGKEGAEDIQRMMMDFREKPFRKIADIRVRCFKDYKSQKELNMLTNETQTIPLPKSDVLQFELIDGSMITVRPSGTEPKIKFYFGIKQSLASKEELAECLILANKKIEKIVSFLELT